MVKTSHFQAGSKIHGWEKGEGNWWDNQERREAKQEIGKNVEQRKKGERKKKKE